MQKKMPKKKLWKVNVKGLVDPKDDSPLDCVYLRADDEQQVWMIFRRMWIEDSITDIVQVKRILANGYLWDYWATVGLQ